MRRSTLFPWVFVLTLLAYVVPAHAQATRTWISGVGDDANPCSRTAPCKTFAGAISKTTAGGEIDALDPGGFGGLTITKSITLDGGGGQVASILVAGTNGVVVAAATTDVIVIKNLRFMGLLGGGNANAGLGGIKVLTAQRVSIINCDLNGFGTAGVWGNPGSGTVAIDIAGTTSEGSALGMWMNPTGGATINVSISNSHIDNNVGGGLKLDTTGTGGGTINASVSDSTMSLNAGNGLLALSGPSGGGITVNATRNAFSNNAASGVQSNNSAGGNATVNVGESAFINNTSGAVNFAGTAKVQTYVNGTAGTNLITAPQGTGFNGTVAIQ